MIYFTSDHHFGHTNIIKYAQRPFETVKVMDDTLVANWNRVVQPNDIVYHLGDFTLNDYAADYFKRLNGHIHVLQYPYHHDGHWLANGEPLFGREGQVVVFEDGIRVLQIRPEQLGHEGSWAIPVVLCHYEFQTWDRQHYGAWHLFGHDHRTANQVVQNVFKLNVGVDANGFAPVSLNDIHAAMVQRGWYYGWRQHTS